MTTREGIRLEVQSSYTRDELSAYPAFSLFFDAVKVQNGYEPNFSARRLRAHYLAAFLELREEYGAALAIRRTKTPLKRTRKGARSYGIK